MSRTAPYGAGAGAHPAPRLASNGANAPMRP